MRKTRFFVIIYVVISIFLLSCKGNETGSERPSSASSPTPSVNVSSPINIIVILDTSNRIWEKKNPGQAQRDQEIITMIIDKFEKMAIKFIQTTDDQEYPYTLTFAVPPEYGASPIPADITNNLIIKPEKSAPQFKKQRQKLDKAIENLYGFVKKRDKFPGSDIWRWFKRHAHLQNDAENLIICLSDGYLNFDEAIEKGLKKGRYMEVGKLRSDQNWKQKIQNEGLLETGSDLGSYKVKFRMIEITLAKTELGVPYEKDFDIIRCYWETWLKSMGIKDTDFAESGVSVERLIDNLFGR